MLTSLVSCCALGLMSLKYPGIKSADTLLISDVYLKHLIYLHVLFYDTHWEVKGPSVSPDMVSP